MRTGFKHVSSLDAAGLAGNGFKLTSAKECKHVLFGTTVTVTVPTIADDYWWRLLARLKTIYIGQGRGVRLPWEKLIWGDRDPIEYCPQAVRVPEEHLEENMNARDQLCTFFPDAPQTLSQMIEIVKKHERTLLDLSKDFAQECDFIYNRAGPMLEKKITDGLLNFFPNPDKPGEFKGSLSSAHSEVCRVKQTAIFLAIDKDFKRQVTTLEHALCMTIEGKGPSSLADFRGSFLSLFDTRLSLFYKVNVKNEGVAKGFKTKAAFGADAARHDYIKYQAAKNGQGNIRDFVPNLRKFAWLLTEKEQRDVENTVRQAVHDKAARIVPNALLDKEQAAVGDKSSGKDGTLAVFLPIQGPAALSLDVAEGHPGASSSSANPASSTSKSSAAKAKKDLKTRLKGLWGK